MYMTFIFKHKPKTSNIGRGNERLFVFSGLHDQYSRQTRIC